jgi:tryptophanyl-tRNA synthetase
MEGTSPKSTPKSKGAPPAKKRILSGMRPTGRLHVGHWVGALKNWVRLQDEYQAFHMVADWHAVTSQYEDTSNIQDNTREMAIDWLSVGLDPEKAAFFVQSQVKEHAELALLLGMFTPVPWLTRTPSYKEMVLEAKDKTLETLGFLGYPVLQAADILIYKAHAVPVGDDQVPHLEMCRELVRRFNFLHGRLFPEPQPILSPTPRLLGSDGRKMSKSFDNCIYLSDPAKTVAKKVSQMVTDPARIRRDDLGHPEVCSVFDYHKVFNKQEVEQIEADCRSAALGCTDCKKRLGEEINDVLEPMRDKRAEFERKPKRVDAILRDGTKRAREFACATMGEVRDALHLP